jgi:hypothetical protein
MPGSFTWKGLSQAQEATSGEPIVSIKRVLLTNIKQRRVAILSPGLGPAWRGEVHFLGSCDLYTLMQSLSSPLALIRLSLLIKTQLGN